MRWLALFYTVCLLAAGATLASRGRPEAETKAALFFISNEPSGNHVLTAEVESTGKVSFKKAFHTGGKGAIGVSSPRASESLFSGGGSIAVSPRAGLVAAVNAGSNTISLLSINPEDPTELFPVGRPAPSGGEFPMSVVFNEAGTKLCALNGGKIAGVRCFDVNKRFGLSVIPETTQHLALNQTTPPAGPPATASQILFNHDETQLIAAVKGVPPPVGFLAVWDVERHGALARTHRTVSPPSGGALPFSLTAVPGTRAFLSADPALGFEMFDMADPKRGAAVPVPGQVAICWSARSAKTGHFFLTDTGASVISEVAVDHNLKGSLVKQFTLGDTGIGITDVDTGIVGSKEFMFTLGTNATSVVAMRVDGPGKVTQLGSFNYAEFFKHQGLRVDPQTAQGMIVFVKTEERRF